MTDRPLIPGYVDAEAFMASERERVRLREALEGLRYRGSRCFCAYINGKHDLACKAATAALAACGPKVDE